MKALHLGLLIFLISFIGGCTSPKNNINKNLEELDKLYGYCDNPHRDLNKREYKICKDKQRAAGEGFVFKEQSIQELLLKSIKDDLGSTGVAGGNTNVNNYLWHGALQTLQNYPLKNVEPNGGYLETDWIYQDSNPNERCLIKVNIISKELVSTGVRSKIICQNKNINEWQNIGDDIYVDQSKQITLSILNNANDLRLSNINSN